MLSGGLEVFSNSGIFSLIVGWSFVQFHESYASKFLMRPIYFYYFLTDKSNCESLPPCPRKDRRPVLSRLVQKDHITDLLDDEGTLALTIRSESFLPGQQLQGGSKVLELKRTY
jgi:hypothetical protein